LHPNTTTELHTTTDLHTGTNANANAILMNDARVAVFINALR
jgi:hypothetical protein